MTDATLGLVIDSSQAAPAAAALDKLTASAASAQTAANKLGNTFKTAFSSAASSAASQITDIQRRINQATGVGAGANTGSRAQDIAAYGTELDRLRAKFNPLYAASKQYETELNELNDAQRVGAITSAEHEQALERMNARYATLGNAAALAGKSFQGMSFAARNLSFQLVDVGQGILMGQSAFMIFAQQAGQIGQIAAFSGQSVGSMFKEIGASFASLITPMRLVTLGVAAIGVAVYAGFESWKNYALQLDDVRRLTGQTSESLSALNSAAAFKGVSDSEFFDGMRSFNDQVVQAQHGMGTLGQLLRANGKTAGTTAEAFGKVADLVKNAGSEQQKINILQEAGLPTTRQWRDLMSQGAAGIEEAKELAVAFGGAANDEMVQKAKEFEQAWNTAIQNLKTDFRSLFLGVVDGFDSLVMHIRQLSIEFDKLTGGSGKTIPNNVLANAMKGGFVPGANQRLSAGSDVSQFYNAFGSRFTSPASSQKSTTSADALKSLQNYQAFVSMLGDIATTSQVVKAKQDELSAAFIQSGVSVGKYRDAILALTAAQHDYSRASLQASLGVQTFDVATMAAKEVNAEVKAGLVPMSHYNNALTAATQKWKALGEQAQIAGSKFPNLTQWTLDAGDFNKQIDQVTSGSLDQITTSLTDMATGAKSAGDAFKDMANYITRAIEQMIIKMYVIEPLAKSLQSTLSGFGGGGLGGLLGGLFGGGGPTNVVGAAGALAVPTFHTGGIVGINGASRYVHPAYFENAPRFHSGGVLPGEVPAILKPGEGVFTPAQMAAMGNGGSVNVAIYNAPAGTTATATQSRDINGNRRIDITLKRTMDDTGAGLIDSGESAMNKSLERRYGLQPRL